MLYLFIFYKKKKKMMYVWTILLLHAQSCQIFYYPTDNVLKLKMADQSAIFNG